MTDKLRSVLARYSRDDAMKRDVMDAADQALEVDSDLYPPDLWHWLAAEVERIDATSVARAFRASEGPDALQIGFFVGGTGNAKMP